jgi:glycosyltransferase involved in cell wall biosynthesis
MLMPTPLRVLHALSLDVYGGLEVLFQSYLTHPLARTMEHHVLVAHGRCHPALQSSVQQCARSVQYARYFHGVKIPRWPESLRERWACRAARSVHADVTMLYSALGNSQLIRAARKSGASLLYYEHGGAWQAPVRPEAQEFLRSAKGILCNSKAARRMLELRWGVPKGFATVQLNPLRAGLTGRSSPPRELRTGAPVRLGLAGRLAPVKGFAAAFHALRLLLDRKTPCRLRVAGDGPERQSLRALAERLRLTDACEFLGRVQDMAGFYGEVDVLLCPSIRESLGNVCVEAGYFGCPVVCAAVDGMPEVVLDGRTGFCVPPTIPLSESPEYRPFAPKLPEQVYDPLSDCLAPPRLVDPARLAGSVRMLIEDPALYARMSRGARERIASFFTLDAYVAAVNDKIAQTVMPQLSARLGT